MNKLPTQARVKITVIQFFQENHKRGTDGQKSKKITTLQGLM